MSSAVMTRVMIDPKKDSFYAGDYIVEHKMSLNMFDPKENSNKFYIIEVHHNENHDDFRLYINYGRVGANGQHRSKAYSSAIGVKNEFDKTIKSKEKKGYIQVDLATTSRGSSVGKTVVNAASLGGLLDASKVVSKIKSKLSKEVQDLVQKIYLEANQAVSMSMTGTVKSNIKAPLGTIGVNGIKKGRMVLGDIARSIANGDISGIEANSVAYYRNIPRLLPSNVTLDRSWVLDTQSKVDRELEILELYEDTLRMLPIMGNNDIDVKYSGLQCDLEYVTDAKTIEYVANRVSKEYASNHRFRAKVKNVYGVKQKNAPKFDDSCGNVRHLFHGTRGANLVGILSSHLKLPTQLKGVHITGAMFGPGIYFGEFSKSLQYSMNRFGGGGNRTDSVYMFVCEVALGEVYKTTGSKYYTKAPNGYNSVMGVGQDTLKRVIERGELPSNTRASLVNNEYIIYNQSRQRIKYLIELEMV